MSNLFRWQGNGPGVKSAYDDGRNWVDESDAPYPEGRYPGSSGGVNDEILFDIPVASGASSPSGYDGSALDMITSFRVAKTYDGAIGTEGNPLKLLIVSMSIDGQASESIHLWSTNGDTAGAILSGNSINLYGESNELIFLGGNGKIRTGAVLMNSVFGGAAQFVIEDGAIVNTITLAGGMVENFSEGYVPSGVPTNISVMQYGGTFVGHTHVSHYRGVIGNYNWVDGDIYDAQIDDATVDGSNGFKPRNIWKMVCNGNGTINTNNGLNNIRIMSGATMNAGSFVPSPGFVIWEKGLFDCLPGIASHTGSGDAAASSPYVYVSSYDHITFYCSDSSGAAALVAYFLDCASDDAGTGIQEVSVLPGEGLLQSETGATSHLGMVAFGIWGYQLPADKRWMKARMVHMSGTTTTASVVIVRHRF